MNLWNFWKFNFCENVLIALNEEINLIVNAYKDKTGWLANDVPLEEWKLQLLTVNSADTSIINFGK